MTPLEDAAFVVSVVGVWLTTARSLWNYPFSLLSVALYAVFFYRLKLYADMGLQVIFAGTLVYGLWQWLNGRSVTGELLVARIGGVEMRLGLGLGLVLGASLGFVLHTYTDASLPWADSLLFAASLVASVWAARRYVESWWAWVIIDVLYVGLYVAKQAYPTAVLYAGFVGLAVVGLRRWQLALASQQRAPPVPQGSPLETS
jgi:nicotinamide mononucleotide transporter